MRRALYGLVTIILLSSCETTNEAFADHRSQPVPAAAAAAIAQDMAQNLTSQTIPSTRQAIKLSADPSGHTMGLQAALESGGYPVVPEGGEDGAHAIASSQYVVEEMEGQLLARLSTPEIILARTYSVTATGAAPASPLAIMQLR